jgi:hypothetical protein
MERCLILAHLHSGNPSYTDPMKSRLMVSVNRKDTAELAAELATTQPEPRDWLALELENTLQHSLL